MCDNAYTESVKEGRVLLRQRMNRIFKNEDVDFEYINSKSIYELEEDLNIKHYNLFGNSDYRWGHHPLSKSSRKRVESNIKFLMKR